MATSHRIELIFDHDCPNAPIARDRLGAALARLGQVPSWQEWERSAAGTPGYAIRFGSPTVLVDGRDVAGQPPTDAPCCRLYRGANGGRDVAPPAELLHAALVDAAPGRGNRDGWLGSLAAVPGIAAAMLPAVACPACWPTYVAALGSLGLGTLAQRSVQLPLTALLMVGAVVMLAWGARHRHGYGPALLAGLAGGLVLVGKFALDIAAVHWTGSALLIASVVWNAWPVAVRDGACCVVPGAKGGEARPSPNADVTP